MSFIIVVYLFVNPQIDAQAKTFKDVSKKHSAYNEIVFLANKKIISGYNDGTFKPSQYVTNAQAVSMAVKAHRLESKSYKNPGFKDVSKQNSNYKNIAIAATYGLIEKGEKFYPNEPITREKMARLIMYDYVNQWVFPKSESLFKDVAVNNPYRIYIERLSSFSYKTGYPDGTFKPKGFVIRANYSQFLARYLGESNFYEKRLVKNAPDSPVLRNVPKTLKFEYVDKTTTRLDSYTLNETPAYIKSNVTDKEYVHTYEADDQSGNFIQYGYQDFVLAYRIRALDKHIGEGGVQLLYPMKEKDYYSSFISPSIEELTPADEKVLDKKWNVITVHQTIVSLTHTMTLGKQTFNDVIVMEIATYVGRFATKVYISRNDGILKVENANFTYTRIFE